MFEETRRSSKDLITAIRCCGSDFVATDALMTHPDKSLISGSDRQDIKQTRYDVHCHLKRHGDQLSMWQVFEAAYSGYIKINSWTDEVFFDGGIYPTSRDKLLNLLEDALGMPLLFTKDFLDRRWGELIEHKKFSPVKRYLQGLPEPSSADWEIWNSLANTLFGTSGDMSQIYLSKWLISAVARVMKPGVKADSALVIKGKQGIGKTSFLAALFGDHFRTLHSHQSTLEQQRIMQQAWAIELGEIEATFRSKDISALKALMSATHDDYRDPYQKAPESRPQHLVYAGTTNESAFLNDPTGNRRFWVVDAANYKIPVAWVEENRDRIWSVAKHLWEDGQQHFLSQDEEELSELSNKAFATENPFEEPLRFALDFFEDHYKDISDSIAISNSDALTHILGIKPENHTRHSRVLAAAMESLGYTRKQFKNKTLNGRFYVKPDASEPIAFDQGMVTQLEAYRHNPSRPKHKT